MTIVFRPVSPPSFVDLGRAGVCRVAVGEVIGSWGRGPWRVEYLRATEQPVEGETPCRDNCESTTG